MKHYVYLAGAITGLTYKGATDWRDFVASQLDSDKVETLSPMRGKNFLLDVGILQNGTYDDKVISSGKGIMRRDFFDCTRASCVFVNLLGAQRVSIGTVLEVAWAYQAKIPVIVVMEQDNMHNHVMFNEAATYIVRTIEEAVELTKFLFNDKR
jgi:hypothetical protein